MYNAIGLAEFEQLQKTAELRIIDVREEDEYAAGHIPNSQNIPLSKIQTGAFDLAQGPEYYLICQAGGRSAMAGQILAEDGHTVVNVLGGMSAWRGAVEG